jgi:hypothetical protein
LNVIRNNSHFYAIRAVASLYNLFEETVKEQSELTVVIDSVAQLQGHGALDNPVALIGLEVDLAGSCTDVGLVDAHTADISWGDGSTDTDPDFDAFNDCVGGVTGTLMAAHIYVAPGIYTFTLNVTDDDAGVGTATDQREVVDAAGAIGAVVERLTPLATDPQIGGRRVHGGS